ncbi:hypothetical protein GO730_04150 [Spirosoma sp. HMF3257]|uniref:HTH LytTR-type domain-containing protein n=1 Tax=Spirosoma telluris TaxID=2183553 RepID=A0A327NIM7_9BACT|nr:hypothetical protein [Spirosoma telluris]RAI73794.1 hypothetical protein HMF3257_04115 [Spirosoma telluris]
MKIRKYIIANYVDDEANHLKELMNKIHFLQLASISSTIEATIEALTNQSIDLILLGLDKSPQAGLNLMKAHIQLPPIIVGSSLPNYAAECYEIGTAADFLLTPLALDRLMVAVNRALTQKRKINDTGETTYIFLKMGRKIQRFDFNLIEYVEAYGIYSKIVYQKQIYVVNERMATLSELLPASTFLRVHKSYIINIAKVTSYDRNHFHIEQEEIPIGISFRPKLEGLLQLFEHPV